MRNRAEAQSGGWGGRREGGISRDEQLSDSQVRSN